ncbi:hypothetical protein OKW34_005520 [Paraburkholderia youngii]|uniref:TnsD family Tn7-like transposition protein n=1 Tax=Paraburkholderia youngii TaxID=2782701 RepID=UPI003D23F7D4
MEGLFVAAGNIPLIENETISNYLRQVRAVASEHEKAVLREALGNSRFHQCSPLYPSNLQAMRKLITSLPSVAHMLCSNTGVDVMRLTVSPADYERFFRHSAFGERQPIAALSGITRNRSQRGPIERYFEDALCPECIDEDTAVNGRTFVRRQWAYSKIAVCTKHRVSLMTACERCRSSTSYKDSLHRFRRMCVCNESPLVSRTRSENSAVFMSELRVADALDALFRVAKNPSLDLRHTRYVYRRQALRLGFLTSRYQYEKILRLSEKKLHAEVISKHEMRFAKGSGAAEMLRGEASLRSPLENALLVCTLFDSSEEFEVAMKAAKELPVEDLLSPVRNTEWRSKSTPSRHLEQAKERVRNYVRDNPQASRTDVWRTLSYCFKVLLQHEPQSIDDLLPARKPRRNGASRPAPDFKEEDLRFEAHVRKRYAAFHRHPPKFRITKARLKEGWRGAGSFPTNKWRLPLTLAALNELQESTDEYRKRKGIERRWDTPKRVHGEVA